MNAEARQEGPVILGAGLAGTLLAIFLARRGHSVRLIERNPDLRRHTAPAGRSINLALAERGIHALKKAGVFDQVKELLIPMRGRMLHDPEGQLKLQPYSRNADEVIYSVSRSGLTATLLDAAEQTGKVEILFNHSITGLDIGNSELTVTTGLLDGAQVLRARPIIAADGAGSLVRRTLAEAGLIDASEELLSHGYKELTIAPAADGGFRMDPNALHIWPRGGFMLIALPNPDASFTVTLFMAYDAKPGFEQLDTRERVLAFFREEFPDAVPLIPGLAEEFFKNPTGILGTIRCRPWYEGDKALLIGDAAHAIVPFHGQGMNCAFEDCVVLDEMLATDNALSEDLFARFSESRKPNADAIADMALDNYLEMRDRVNDPNFHLQKSLAWELEAKIPERFVPRYSMVMFRRIPYAVAQRRGAKQAALLKKLAHGAATLADIDMEHALQVVKDELPVMDPDRLADQALQT